MGIINQLDFQVANLIAAGEVVERPASCVKELLENALDAHATEITVEIKRGGVSFIRVADNGCGMAKDDLPISIKRHATSKIKTAADLDGITTLGFRGEALAAIASVSRLRIMTKRKEDKYGALLTADCGKIEDIVEVGGKNGTTVIVENLFANVPARRKFLKRDASEALAVSGIVERLAISRPDIAFKLIVDGNLKFSTPGDNRLISAVYAALGKDFAEKLVKVRNVTEGIEVIGYICRPESVRANRTGQNFFINGRYVRSKTATAALEQAFDSYCEVGKFPFCVLFINVHPSLVDVNVHPTKLEVKFSNERAMFDAIYCAVRNTLSDSAVTGEPILEPRRVTPTERGLYNAFVPIEDRLENTPVAPITPKQAFDEPSIGDLLPPETGFDRKVRETQAPPPTLEAAEAAVKTPLPPPAPQEAPSATIPEAAIPTQEEKPTANDFFASLSSLGVADALADTPSEEKPISPPPAPSLAPDAKTPDETPRPDTPDTAETPDASTALPPYRIIGVAFHAYIMVEVGDVTLILDKHAAHERILFEKMKQNRAKSRETAAVQMLMIPVECPLSPEERAALAEYADELLKNGFDFTLTEKSAILTAIPTGFSTDEVIDMLAVMAERLASGTGSVEVSRAMFYEKALYQASCKAAMKAGLADTPENIKWLVETVLQNPAIRYCPHGRPIAFELSRRDMEKFFKRT